MITAGNLHIRSYIIYLTRKFHFHNIASMFYCIWSLGKLKNFHENLFKRTFYIYIFEHISFFSYNFCCCCYFSYIFFYFFFLTKQHSILYRVYTTKYEKLNGKNFIKKKKKSSSSQMQIASILEAFSVYK